MSPGVYQISASYQLFCDESGNSGSNFLDTGQPVYVLAGWLVPESARADAEQRIQGLHRAVSPSAPELHGKRLLKTVRGRQAATALFCDLQDAGCIPLSLMSEKRYAIAAKIVETFLDPYYNSSITDRLGWDIELKQRLANDLYELPDMYLSEFAEAYRACDAAKLRTSLGRLTTVLSLRLDTELADAIRGSLERVDDIAQAEATASVSLPNRALASLNLPTFVSFLSVAEDVGRFINAPAIHITHDHSKEFAHGFRWAFETFKNARPGREVRLPSGYLMAFRFQSVRSFTMADSRRAPIIQAADMLATALCSYATHIALERQPPQELLDIARMILPGALLKPATPMRCGGSTWFLRSVFGPVFPQLPSA